MALANSPEKHEKLIVIGLDGATFDIIEPLTRMGRLPNINGIMRNGVHGELHSTIHPVTPQAWTSFLTGKNAGKHGIFDFMYRKEGEYGIRFCNASLRKAESLFFILSKANKRVGAIAIPFSFPPEEVNGFMLSGMDSPAEDERAVYPGWLYEEIENEFGHYYIHLASPVGRRVDDERFWHDILKEDQNRTLISKYLMQRYPCDLFMVVYNNTDRVAHQHFDEAFHSNLQENRHIGHNDFLVKTYENIDAQVGCLLSDLDENTSVLIMSDHGSGPIKKVFFLNRWLEKHGFLVYDPKTRGSFFNVIDQARFLAKRFLPRQAKNFMKSRMSGLRDKVDSVLSFSEIAWDQTKAYGFGTYGNIYINLAGREPKGTVKPEEYDSVCNELIEKLMRLEDPDTGERIVENVYRRDDLYHGPSLALAPDLLIGWKDYAYYTSVTLGRENGSVFGPPTNIDCSEYKHVGTHRLKGIFMATGPNTQKGQRVFGARICDIAPTILYMLGQPVPEDMDGRVLLEIFQEKHVRDHPVRYDEVSNASTQRDAFVEFSERENQEIAERLKGLGYLG
jgi:predicted AlkP superfamily phosphohydrolase/phosphomutase